jgi:hypothetical protein
VYRAFRTPMVRACALVVLVSLAACGGGSGDESPVVSGAPASGGSTAAGAVAISGPKVDAAVADQRYEFVPDVGDTGGAEVAFSIENKPAWATFDQAAGTLSGTPTGSDVGSRSTVRITATAAGKRATLELQLQVVATAAGVASIALEAPTTRTDGTVLQNLAGYRVYYGKTATRLDQFVDVKDRAATGVEVARLTPGTWYFAATAYDANGLESEPAELGNKTIG